MARVTVYESDDKAYENLGKRRDPARTLVLFLHRRVKVRHTHPETASQRDG